MIVKQFVNDTIQPRLEKFPNLKRYVEEFNLTDGDGENYNLTTWFRRTIEKSKVKFLYEFFEWGEKEEEFFYSYNENDRWSRALRNFMSDSDYFEFYVGKALDLAEEYGDINVD